MSDSLEKLCAQEELNGKMAGLRIKTTHDETVTEVKKSE